MRRSLIEAVILAIALLSAGCAGGDLDAPSARDPSSPRAPEAPFDAGTNPLSAVLSPPPPSTGEMPSGHKHGGGAPMTVPAPSSSGKR